MQSINKIITTGVFLFVTVVLGFFLWSNPVAAACDGWCSGLSSQPFGGIAGQVCRYSVEDPNGTPYCQANFGSNSKCWVTESVNCTMPPNTCTSTGCQTGTCTPNWSCGSWGECQGTWQSRTCTDLNNCGTSAGRPSEWQQCTLCSPTSSNWSAWTDTSTCTATCGGGTKTQSRTCEGTVSCGGTNNCTGSSTQTVSCNTQACAVNGACGTAAKTYNASDSDFSGSLCSAGSASPSAPNFPFYGGSASWTCQGAGGGTNATCYAYRKPATPVVSVSPSSIAAGASVTFSWPAATGASFYYIAYGRDGVWPQSHTNIGNVTSQIYTDTSGLTQSIAAEVVACSSLLCGDDSNIASATVNTPPSVDFTASPTIGVVPLTVNFTSSNSGGTITSYNWNFGDGPPAGTGASPSRTYSVTGTYSVTVLASGPGGSSSKSRTNYITVNPPAPTAPTVTADPTTVAPGGDVTFSWSPPTNATSYLITYRRDNSWDAGYSDIQNNTSRVVSTSGLTSGVAAKVKACNVSGCSDPSNVASSSIASAPTADIKANNSNGNINIDYNTAATISWISGNATNCSVTQTGSTTTWTGTSNSGISTGNLTVSRTYTLTCTGLGGTGTDSITVNVPAPEVSITGLTASPSSGTAPVNGVDFTVTAGGTAIGNIEYRIDCTNNSSWEVDAVTTSNPYTAVDACNYPTGGNYTAKVSVTRDAVTVNQNLSLSWTYSPATVDIKANNADGPVNVPANGSVSLSWTSTNATACSASGDWSGGQATQSTGTSQSIATASKTFTLTCTGLGASATDSVTVNPIPPPPANVRVTSASPYIKGNTISFAWDAAPAATYYGVAYYLNGSWDMNLVSPSPESATTVSYSNTANLNTLGIKVIACRTPGICGSFSSLASVSLLDPTPANITTSPTTTSDSAFSASVSSASDVDYVRINSSNIDLLYRVRVQQGSPNANVTVTVVDSNGNVINNSSLVRQGSLDAPGTDVIFKVPASSGNEKYLKFQGTRSGNYTYTLKRVRLFPYLEAQ